MVIPHIVGDNYFNACPVVIIGPGKSTRGEHPKGVSISYLNSLSVVQCYICQPSNYAPVSPV